MSSDLTGLNPVPVVELQFKSRTPFITVCPYTSNPPEYFELRPPVRSHLLFVYVLYRPNSDDSIYIFLSANMDQLQQPSIPTLSLFLMCGEFTCHHANTQLWKTHNPYQNAWCANVQTPRRGNVSSTIKYIVCV